MLPLSLPTNTIIPIHCWRRPTPAPPQLRIIENRPTPWSVPDYLQHCAGSGLLPRLVVGCGLTPEHVRIADSISGIPCSLGHDHRHDLTLNIEREAAPDLLMDLVTFRGSPLYEARNRLDTIVFEFVGGERNQAPSEQRVTAWFSAAFELLVNNGQIEFYNSNTRDQAIAESIMRKVGFDQIRRRHIGAPTVLAGTTFLLAIKP